MLSRAGWKDGEVEGVSIRRQLVCENAERAPPQTPLRLRSGQASRRSSRPERVWTPLRMTTRGRAAMMRDSVVVGMGYFQRVMRSRAGWKDGGVEGVGIRRQLVCENGDVALPQVPLRLRSGQALRRSSRPERAWAPLRMTRRGGAAMMRDSEVVGISEASDPSLRSG